MDILYGHTTGQARHVLDIKPEVDLELADIIMSLGTIQLHHELQRSYCPAWYSRVSMGSPSRSMSGVGPQLEQRDVRGHADVTELPDQIVGSQIRLLQIAFFGLSPSDWRLSPLPDDASGTSGFADNCLRLRGRAPDAR